jgi:thiosulfate/3-mercaptopyruvate sulfurtransferase
MSATSPYVVSADWLQERLGKPGLSIVDGSWYLPAHGRDARAEYQAGHIPGAVFFDHDRVVEPGSELPHTLPSPLLFAQFASSMGVDEKDEIVVYDGPGFYAAPRVWWMFRLMGAHNVYVLDGGFDRWRREGRPVTAETTKIASCFFEADCEPSRVVSFDEMKEIVGQGSAQRPGRLAVARGQPAAGGGIARGAGGGRPRSVEARGHLLRLRRHRGGDLARARLGRP